MHTPIDPVPPGGVTDLHPDLPLDAAGTADPSPVFVDGTGRRRKGWRRLTLVLVAALCGYATLLGIGFAGGPIPPAALLPIPGVPGNAPETASAPPNAPEQATGARSAAGSSPGSGSKRSGAPSRPNQAATHTGSPATNTAGVPQPTAVTGTAQPSTTPPETTAPTGTSAATTGPVHGPSATPPSHSHSNTKNH